MRPRVKICGITRLEDGRAALELGADELGFVFASSPRRISPEAARAVVAALREGPRGFRAIGVFVNEAPDAMRDILSFAGLDAAQIHGDEGPGACAAFDFPWYRALRPSTLEAALAISAEGWTCPRILAEAAAAGAYGGTGAVLADGIALAAASAAKAVGAEFFLAGGLGPATVAGRIAAVRPDGIDLSSGVEESPGRKSRSLLEALFRAIDSVGDEEGSGGERHGAR